MASKKMQKRKSSPVSSFLWITVIACGLVLVAPNLTGVLIAAALYGIWFVRYRSGRPRGAVTPLVISEKVIPRENVKASFRASKAMREVTKRDEDAFELFGENDQPPVGFTLPKSTPGFQATTQTAPLRKPNKPSAADCWVPQDIAFTVHQYRIHSGLVYCGSGLESVVERGSPEPALVNEKLPIGTDDEYYSRKLEYYPNYASASLDARAGYLNWLANGRRDKKSNIGYVYLYFYGLERRAFIDVHTDPAARAEIPAIIDEVEALLTIFKKSKVFVARAHKFVDTLRAVAEGSKLYLEEPPRLDADEGPRFLHSVALAQAYRDDFAYPVEWLLSWYIASTSFARPRAVMRCLPHFKSLFRQALPRTFPTSTRDWLEAENVRRLTLSYDALYPRLGQVDVAMAESNQLRNVIEPHLGLFRLVDSFAKKMADQLEPYSRYVGNSTEKLSSDEAHILLPPTLWQPELLTRFESIAESLVQDGAPSSPLTFGTVFSPLSPRFVASYFRAVVIHLEASFGMSMEPDPRYGAGLPTLDSHIVFFRLPEAERLGETEVLSAEALGVWQEKIRFVWFYAAIVRADTDHQEAKRIAASELTVRTARLTSPEKRRALALFEVLVKDLSAAALKKRAQEFTSSQAAHLAGELVQICQTAGALTGASSIRALEKLFALLGQDANDLYSMAHVGALAPEVNASPDVGAASLESDLASPSRATPKSGVGLDRKKMARLREETAEASAMLGAIFMQDDTPAVDSKRTSAFTDSTGEGGSQAINSEAAPPNPLHTVTFGSVVGADENTTSSVHLPGLNAAHHSLLVQLLEKGAWERAEIIALCAPLGLMVDAAVERINEAAFDKFDDSLLDGDDTFEINPDIAGELRS